jgi:hypothetical protein
MTSYQIRLFVDKAAKTPAAAITQIGLDHELVLCFPDVDRRLGIGIPVPDRFRSTCL